MSDVLMRGLQQQDEAADALAARSAYRKDNEKWLGNLTRWLGRGHNQDSLDFRSVPWANKKWKTGGENARYALQSYYSPQGQIVDSLVSDARDLSSGLEDPDSSERWQRLYGSLTEAPLAEVEAGVTNARRDLAFAGREAELGMQDLSAGRGVGRNPMAEREQLARHRERLGTAGAMIETNAGAQRAQILGNASQWMETFVREYSANVAGFAQKWASNSPGFRESFQSSLNALAETRAKILSESSRQNINYATNREALQAEDSGTDWIGIAGTVAGVGLSLWSGGAFAGLGAGLGGGVLFGGSGFEPNLPGNTSSNYTSSW